MQTFFSQFGPVEKIETFTDKETGRKKGFAFVTFGDFDSADKCYCELHLKGMNLVESTGYWAVHIILCPATKHRNSLVTLSSPSCDILHENPSTYKIEHTVRLTLHFRWHFQFHCIFYFPLQCLLHHNHSVKSTSRVSKLKWRKHKTPPIGTKAIIWAEEGELFIWEQYLTCSFQY